MKDEVVLFEDGKDKGLETSCQSEGQFIYAFTVALLNVIESKSHEGDEQFHVERWMENFADMIVKYRGFKNDKVTVSTYFATGWTSGTPISAQRALTNADLFPTPVEEE